MYIIKYKFYLILNFVKIKIWFQNKRSKLKKAMRQGHDPSDFLNAILNESNTEIIMVSCFFIKRNNNVLLFLLLLF